MDEALVIDCDSCPMHNSTACDDCVVGVLLARSRPDEESESAWAGRTDMRPRRQQDRANVRWRDRQEPLWR